MSTVFNESLDGGYHHYYGRHECRLNWAGEDRPQSNKSRVVNYNHALNGLQQEVEDDLTRQGVLADPQELGISNRQSARPSCRGIIGQRTSSRTSSPRTTSVEKHCCHGSIQRLLPKPHVG